MSVSQFHQTETCLSKSAWQTLATAHRQSMSQWTEPFRARRRIGQSHPIHDFLFIYYQYSPAKLEQWHPGAGIQLCDGEEFSNSVAPAQYSTVDGKTFCDPNLMDAKTLSRLRWTAELLQQTENRKPNFSCLGLHEWAMVYRGDEIRHEKTTPLRLPQSEIDALVESRPLTCSHFDAFRFFAIQAQPLNQVQPTLEDRVSLEQPACIHANMDLYKWAFKSMPWIGSDLLKRCFDMAMCAREIDMRASPYDLNEYGCYEPIKVETPQGRAQYEQEQRKIAEIAAPLRTELRQKIEYVLSFVQKSE